jgi:hypothetical protein
MEKEYRDVLNGLEISDSGMQEMKNRCSRRNFFGHPDVVSNAVKIIDELHKNQKITSDERDAVKLTNTISENGLSRSLEQKRLRVQ